MAERGIATEESLKAELLEFEQRYGVDSFELRRLHVADEAPAQVDPHDRAVWLGTLERWEWVRERMRQRAASSR